MKILIVGLGLMGASYAMGLSKKGHTVYGMDQNAEVLAYAIEHGYIQAGYQNSNEIINDADMIILAIYPEAILPFLSQHQSYFHQGQIITDICGVKSSFVHRATLLCGKATYCSHHPMAGKEKIGIKYADDSIFKDANFLITPLNRTPIDAIKKIEGIARDLSFKRVSVISPERHDQMIGFTSQLTHAIAVSLVNSDHDPETGHFIGDSYRDLTRIAMINDVLWSELFLENRDVLLSHIESFEHELDLLKDALQNKDKEQLKRIFKNSTETRKKMEKNA